MLMEQGERVSEGHDFFSYDFFCAIQKYLSNNREKTREDEWDNELPFRTGVELPECESLGKGEWLCPQHVGFEGQQ